MNRRGLAQKRIVLAAGEGALAEVKRSERAPFKRLFGLFDGSWGLEQES